MSNATGTLTIDLDAIRANWRRLCDKLPGRPAAVIKADAYGLGADTIGPWLYRLGCREFFVATLPEALSARHFLPDEARVFVLGGVRPGDEPEFINANLTPVLYSRASVERWARACRSVDVSSPSALKVDTGMTRLGLSRTDWRQLLEEPDWLSACHPVLLMSHLACADEPDHPMNRAQRDRFAEMAAQGRQQLPGIRCSLANSAGIFLGSDWHFDQARPGSALYGFTPHPGRLPELAPVVSLSLPVLQYRELGEPARIGYGATAELPAGRRLAVVAGGYADGLHNVLGRSGGYGYLDGTRVPVVGRISMDTTVFDVTNAQKPAQPESARIRVLDERATVAEVSRRTGALGYEVLTSLAGRYRRLYTGGANGK